MSVRFWAWGATRPSLLLLAALLPVVAHAAIYSWTDPGGTVHYSDTPARGATTVHPGRGNAIANPAFNEAGLRRQIPYRDVGGQMHVRGRVDGVAVDFIVDTGASLVVIPPAVAKAAGIATDGTTRLQTANGMMAAPSARIRELTVGGVRAADVQAVVHAVDAAGRTGLLGMNVLGAYRMTIDHGRRLLLLDPK